MFNERRQPGREPRVEAWDHVGGAFPEFPEVQHKANYREGCPEVSAAIDLGFENLHALFLTIRGGHFVEQQTRE
jgi:hypothetical protein